MHDPGSAKTLKIVGKFAKEAAHTAFKTVVDAANKGVLNSANGASTKKVNVNARKAARRALSRVKKAKM